jgi:autotransporter passenger strand-loop-strand repeat protein
VVSSGGTLLDAGVASGTTISSGGGAYILSGGLAVGTTVRGGGADIVQAGATASGTILNGGVEVVSGKTVSTTVNNGGLEFVASGGLASAAVISGGTLEVASGGSTGNSAITFAVSGGGVLRLDDSVHFGGLVAGFDNPDFLDLRDIAFTSATTLSFTEAPSNTSGTLVVSDGTHTANITLLGQFAATQFTSASDGHGGTLIGDLAQTNSAANVLAGAHA